MISVTPSQAAMNYLYRLGIFAPAPFFTWSDITSTLHVLLLRLPSWRIYVAPLSDEWRRQHERESGKR